eukprot:XP_015571431.1 sister chromatid cohesion 1 protein 2 isoform X1 [Ricinus communis]
MFYSHSFLSRKGPLGAIWVAAYCFKKLKKAQVTQTDIASSVDKILQDEFDAVTYRVLAYLLLGVVRIFSKKVEYLFDDCNKVLLKIKDFMVRNKERALMETLCAPYSSITLPERFELDAFNLEIIEDISGGNVVPSEDITVKDGMWKTGAIVPYSLDKYHIEEFTTGQVICSTNYNLNDVISSHPIDFDMAVGTSHYLSSLEASTENYLDNEPNQCESMELEMFPMVEEEPLYPVQSFDEYLHNKAEHTGAIQVVSSDEMHAELSMQELWGNSIFREAGLNLQIFGEVEEEPENSAKSFGEHHQTDGKQIKVPDLTQAENENDEVIKEDCNISNLEVSIEKLRENMVAQEECRDIEMFCMVEEPPEENRSIPDKHKSNTEHKMLYRVDELPEDTRPFGEEHQSSAEHETLLQMTSPRNSTYEALTEDHPLSVTLDTTPRPRFPNASGAMTPEISVIPTPAAKEGARVPRKRKCVFDDTIVFPNNVIKQCIEDSSDLVSKRKKAPHTALTAWRASRVSRLPRCFLESLIPCTASDLRSLLSGKKLKISESLDTVRVPQTFTSECPTARRSVETVESPEKLDKSKILVDGRLVETMDSLEKLNVSASPAVDRQGKTVEPRATLGMSESPTAIRSLEQERIAPETPILHTKSLRTFESPERPEISNLDRVRLESERVEKELSPSKGHELDLNMMNEEISSDEGDNQNQYGWSGRTRVAVRCLHRSFLKQKNRREEEVVNLLSLLEGRAKKESARLFYEILVLKSKGYVHVKQENAYGDILVWKASQWGQACSEDSVEADWRSMYSDS